MNNIVLSRIQRFLQKDPTLPTVCLAKWFYVDVTTKCDCINTCKFTKIKTRKQWIKHANDNYEKILLKNNIKYNNTACSTK